jgi:CheY-like chemotaxis protein
MIENIDQYVAKKLKYYREKFDWPLKKLADDVGVSLQQMHRYEQGTNKISAGLLYKLSKIFKIEIMCFFDSCEEPTEDISTSSYKVLLIEDNPDDEYFFRKCISEFDKELDIYVLRDGVEVLNYFRELQDTSVRLFSQPDIIFMDLNIPSANGFELLNDLKKRPVLNGVPIIILTSSVNEEDAAKSYLLHANGFIKKSFTFKEYSDQLNMALNYWIKTASLPHQA